MLIFPGRFQPFHSGHDEVVSAAMKEFRTQRLVLAVVFDVNLRQAKNDAFDDESAEHFLPERNPMEPADVHSMVQTLARTRYEGRPQVLMIPRPARGPAWKALTKMLPAPRTWIVPDAGEAWDQRKAGFFTEMGDDVVRIPHSPEVSGRTARAAMADGRWDDVARLVPAELIPLLRNVALR